MENESFSTILSHIYQDLVENFDLTNRLEKLKTFAANHPFITMFGIFTVVLCSVPIACFFAFTLFSIFLTFGGFMFLEGTVLTFATIILGGVLILMGVLSIVFSLSVAVGLFVFHKSIDVFSRFHQQFQHAHNYQQQQQQHTPPSAPPSPPSAPPSPPSAPPSPSAPPPQPDNSTSDNNPVTTGSPTNTIYPSLISQLITPVTNSHIPVENMGSNSPTQNTLLTSVPTPTLSANTQAVNEDNVIESNQSQSMSNTQPDHEMLARHDTPHENQIPSNSENIEILGGLADAVSSMTPARDFVNNNTHLRHRSPNVPVNDSNDLAEQDVVYRGQQPLAPIPVVSHDLMTSSLDSSAHLVSDSNTMAVNPQDNPDGLNWETSSSSSSSLNPGDQWEVLPSQAERTQDASGFQP